MSAVNIKRILSRNLTVRVQTGGVEIVSQLADDWRRRKGLAAAGLR